MAEKLLRIEERTKPDYEQPIIETIEGVDRIRGYQNRTTYRIMQYNLCLFESHLIPEVIKYVQELNFEASLILMNLRTRELNAR